MTGDRWTTKSGGMPPNSYITYSDIDGYAEKSLLDSYQVVGTDGYYSKISSADTTPDFLESKITAGSNITITKTNPGGDEALQLSVTPGAGFDGYDVKVSAGDTTPNFLDGKLVAGGLLTYTKQNAGGDESYLLEANLDGYQATGAYITYSDIDGYATKSWVKDGYATIADVALKADLTLLDSYQETGPYITYSDIDSYATDAEVALKADLTLLDSYLTYSDIDSYATDAEVALKADLTLLDSYQVTGPYITYSDIDDYATDAEMALKADLTLLDSYQEVGAYITYSDIDSYAKKTLLDSYQVTGPYITYSDIDDYATDAEMALKADLTLLDSYQEVGAYITYSDIDAYAKKTLLDSYQEVGAYITYSDIDAYAKKTLLDSYATTTSFNDHSARHESGGADAIKLDDLATPDDNTDLDASISEHGLLKKLDNDSSHYLDGTGAWSEPPGAGGISFADIDGYAKKTWVGDGYATTSHAATHIRAGSDEIDGDKLDIDYNPDTDQYVPSTSPAQVTSVDELTAHLAGIAEAIESCTLSLYTNKSLTLTTIGTYYNIDSSSTSYYASNISASNSQITFSLPGDYIFHWTFNCWTGTAGVQYYEIVPRMNGTTNKFIGNRDCPLTSTRKQITGSCLITGVAANDTMYLAVSRSSGTNTALNMNRCIYNIYRISR